MDRDNWIRGRYPSQAARAISLRDAVVEAGDACGLGIDLAGDDDDTAIGICLTFWRDGAVLGCASLDDDGLSYWVEGSGGSNEASDAEFLTAVRNGSPDRR